MWWRTIVSFKLHLPITREEVKARVWSNVIHFFGQVKDIKIPLSQVNLNSLYIFITKTYENKVSKFLIDDIGACMQYLHQHLEDAIIGQCNHNTFRQWNLYGNTHVCPSTYIFLFTITHFFNVGCSIGFYFMCYFFLFVCSLILNNMMFVLHFSYFILSPLAFQEIHLNIMSS
jgi:hypothetical protein